MDPKRPQNPLDRYLVDGRGCWLWTGATNNSGYGTVTIGERRLMAHRAMYEDVRGPIPPGHVLDHLCRQRSCVRPSHLEAVPQSVNEHRKPTVTRVRRGEVCPRGHELVGANKLAGGECRRCNAF